MINIDDYFQGVSKAKQVSCLNEHAGQFYKARCKVTRQLRTEDQMDLKIVDMAPKENMYR